MSGEDISTFVVIDLETNGFPSEQFNKCAITEISLYAFSANCLADKEVNRHIIENIAEGNEGFHSLPPELPRVLNKMTLMINPRRMIDPSAERATGLSNEMLENESPFDENTAKCLNLFLERLEQPVCMVAHNGWSFDYPIIRYVYEKLKMSLPSSVYCVDSFKAFRELDEKSEQIEKTKNVLKMLEADEKDMNKIELSSINGTIEISNQAISCDVLDKNSKIDWKFNNETTPQRKTKSLNSLNNDETALNYSQSKFRGKNRSVSLSVRRSLFADDFKPKTKYPERGVYKLGNIYKRCFKHDPTNLHRAESDVKVLSKLILHYGLDFLAYAEERKQPFANVPKLGASN